MRHLKAFPLLTGIALCAAVSVQAYGQNVPKMVELTRQADASGQTDFVTSSDTSSNDRKQKKLKLLKTIAEQRKEMDKNGYIVVSDVRASLAENLFSDVVGSPLDEETDALAESRLAYTPIDLRAIEQKSGLLVGKLPVRNSDEPIHHMFYAFEIDPIGQLVIEEVSYSTITDATLRVTEASGNVLINGIPGTYIVAVNADETQAVSSLDFWNSTKMFTLTTPTRLPIGSDGYKKLVEIAEALN